MTLSSAAGIKEVMRQSENEELCMQLGAIQQRTETEIGEQFNDGIVDVDWGLVPYEKDGGRYCRSAGRNHQ